MKKARFTDEQIVRILQELDLAFHLALESKKTPHIVGRFS